MSLKMEEIYLSTLMSVLDIWWQTRAFGNKTQLEFTLQKFKVLCMMVVPIITDNARSIRLA